MSRPSESTIPVTIHDRSANKENLSCNSQLICKRSSPDALELHEENIYASLLLDVTSQWEHNPSHNAWLICEQGKCQSQFSIDLKHSSPATLEPHKESIYASLRLDVTSKLVDLGSTIPVTIHDRSANKENLSRNSQLICKRSSPDALELHEENIYASLLLDVTSQWEHNPSHNAWLICEQRKSQSQFSIDLQTQFTRRTWTP